MVLTSTSASVLLRAPTKPLGAAGGLEILGTHVRPVHDGCLRPYVPAGGARRSLTALASRGAGAALAAAALAGCGSEGSPPRAPNPSEAISVGPGPRFRPPALSGAAAAGRSIGRLRCRPGAGGARFFVHLEIFARRRVVAIPSGIGVVPPLTRDGAYVGGGRCVYPARTREPTGLIEVDPAVPLRLGDLFAIWGQPLSATRVAGFTAPPGQTVAAFVAGRRWRGDPRTIPLTRQAVLVLEVEGFVAPHSRYRFPPLR